MRVGEVGCVVLALVAAIACGPEDDRPEPLESIPLYVDASNVADAALFHPCDFGRAVHDDPENDDVEHFTDMAYFTNGASLPADRYRVTYIDSCMRYQSGAPWTIHFDITGDFAWYVGTESGDELQQLPGTTGRTLDNGAFETFDERVDANRARDPREFTHAGGPLGIWLKDSYYADNVRGPRNPTWRLQQMADCGERALRQEVSRRFSAAPPPRAACPGPPAEAVGRDLHALEPGQGHRPRPSARIRPAIVHLSRLYGHDLGSIGHLFRNGRGHPWRIGDLSGPRSSTTSSTGSSTRRICSATTRSASSKRRTRRSRGTSTTD